MHLKPTFASLALGAYTSALVDQSIFEQRCAWLGDNVEIPNATLMSSEFIPANTTLAFPHVDASCGRPSQAVSVSLCRINLKLATSARSEIEMEAWLPLSWSGRFLATGNGGLGGCIQYEDMEYAAALGFATVGSNNGHNGMSGEAFAGNLDVIEDFAFRALHTSVVTGKNITKEFYKQEHTKSYYLGCSMGGRQGLKEAQAFPNDFDGIVAGAPAINFNNLTSWSCHFLPLTGPAGADTFVSTHMWPIIHQDILDQCDTLDGVADKILESPDLCNYDPIRLLCDSQTNATCLSPEQLDTLRKIYSPLFAKDGTLIYPRLQPGAELVGVPETYFTGQPFGAADWYRYAILNDSSWDPITLTEEDYDLSSRLNLFNIATWDGDLSAFKNAGGKLLHYHGLMDQTISSEISPLYYEHVSETMGLKPEALDEFYRYFRISGMAHCGGGPGASFIGNGPRTVASYTPEENVLMAIVRWVEDGIAPEYITGTAYVNGSSSNDVNFKRRHCRWPYRNVYQGVGDANDEESWDCQII